MTAPVSMDNPRVGIGDASPAGKERGPIGRKETKPQTLKEKATGIIKAWYTAAANCKAQSYLSDGHTDTELERTHQAEAMQQLAVELGILTEREAKAIEKEYWDNRDKIPTDIPDRFGD